MGLHQEQMNSVEVKSYKDCSWYVPKMDKCKMPGVGKKYSECTCKKEMKDFCIWITKFIKSTPKDIKLDKEIQEDVTDKYGLYVVDNDKDDSYLANVLNKILKGA